MRRRARIVIGLAAAVAILLVVGVVSAWAPDVPVADLTARYAPPPSQFLPLAGMDVHVRDEGPRDDPTPIVLLHGTSASLHTWEGWARDLSAHRRVIRLDLPGFGLTGPNPTDDYRYETYTRVLLNLLDRLGVARFVIAGNSFGGAVAIATALAAPERVTRLILIDSAGYPLGSTSVPIGFVIASLPGVRAVAGSLLPRWVIARSLRSVYGDPGKVTPELVDLYAAMTRRAGNRQSLIGRRQQAPPDALASRIAELRQPTLVMWGGRDRLIPPTVAHRFLTDIAGSRLVLFDDLGHVPMEEDPARTVAVAKAFLDEAR